MAVIVQARSLLSRSRPSAFRNNNNTSMSILTASATPIQVTMASSNHHNEELARLEEEKNKVQLVMTLAERYGGRAIQRTASMEAEDEKNNQQATSTSPSSPPTFQPFSSTWAARYWQLQKLKAEQALAELEQRAREKESSN
ncbi:hypothetical protein P389DRAFT_59821 [Cystobasidium minutum MCA 4210]|uniref:uncharacterized protein n=1 Tax=Cystobasidium minutum MCA 4210 TaxID=1397322 RepID=UPI0034CD84C9|eukprot:jgi/Rhomi1/59821/CE59820_58344